MPAKIHMVRFSDQTHFTFQGIIMSIQVTELPSGLTVINRFQKDSLVTAIQIWVGIGSKFESDRLAGISHLLEHMMFKGTPLIAVGELAQKIESLGGNINAFTSFDYTVYTLSIPTTAVEAGYKILADAFLNSDISAEELEKEKKVVIHEISMAEEDPETEISQKLFKMIFAQHPYARPIIGNEKNVSSFSREDVRTYYKTNYTPANCSIITVGGLANQKALALAQKYYTLFSGQPKAGLPKALKIRLQDVPESPHITHCPFTDHRIYLGFPIAGIQSEDLFALDVLAMVLGQGSNSRLFHCLKMNNTWVNTVVAYAMTFKDQGMFSIEATPFSQNLKSTLLKICSEMERMKQEPLTQDELARSKITVERDFIYQNESVQGMARMLGSFKVLLNNPRFDETYIKKIQALEASSVLEVAKRTLDLKRAKIIIAGPKGSKLPSRSWVTQNVIKAKERARPKIYRQKEAVVKTLKSGATLIMKNDYHLPTTAMRAVFLGGLLFENKQNNGISQLLSATLLKGSKKHSASEISREIEMMGGVLKSDVGRNSINLSLDILSRNFLPGLEIFMDVLLNPSFEPHLIESEKKVLLADIAASLDHPMQEAFKKFLNVFYGKHPYGQDLLGSCSIVKTLNSKKLIAYHRQLMNPRNMVISVVGQFDMNSAMEKIEHHLQALAVPKKLARVPVSGKLEFKTNFTKKYKLKKGQSQAHILWGYPGVAFKDGHRHSIEILNSVLSGQSGKLFYRLRDELSLAYHVSSTSVEGLDRGHLVIYLATDPAKVSIAVDEIQKIINQVRKESLSDEEIAKAKKIIIGGFENEMQLSAMQALYLGYYQLYGLGHAVLDTYVETIEKLPHARIRQDIADFLDQPHMLAIFSP